jgi:hypothetical protein
LDESLNPKDQDIVQCFVPNCCDHECFKFFCGHSCFTKHKAQKKTPEAETLGHQLDFLIDGQIPKDLELQAGEDTHPYFKLKWDQIMGLLDNQYQ